MVVTDFLLVEGQVDPLRASRLFGSIHFDRHPDCFSSTGRWLSTTSSWPANTACNNKCYKLIRDFPGSTMILRSSSSWNASRGRQKKSQVEYIEFIDDDPRVRRAARAATLHNQLRYLQLQLIVTHGADPDDAGHYIYSILHKAMLHAITADYNYQLLKLATYKRWTRDEQEMTERSALWANC
jgi:hypothetical protein